ncbi:hypothetical protein JXA27_06515 [Aerococcaceae bacterium zg-B36]|uniref:hypothetical protein n=1 Tax=Aerococcaceae bacterium zg-252 TaxID=2796928 RepID=UPI001BD8FEBC|nr:hypothetical protein [Aerococcaceae bacterium zg-B36]
MKILDQHPNGTIMQVVKTYDELTDEEKEKLIISWGLKVADYANFKVDRNKKGVILRVYGFDYSDEKKVEIDARSKEPNIFDAFKRMRPTNKNGEKKDFQEAFIDAVIELEE